MTKIKFNKFPEEVQDIFYAEIEDIISFSSEIGTSVLRKILDMDVHYTAKGMLVGRGVVEFKNEKEYTLFLLKYGKH